MNDSETTTISISLNHFLFILQFLNRKKTPTVVQENRCTFHDGNMDCSPACLRNATLSWTMCDRGTTPTRDHPSPKHTQIPNIHLNL